MVISDRIVKFICCLFYLTGIAQAQEGAAYQDEIERRRQILFPRDENGNRIRQPVERHPSLSQSVSQPPRQTNPFDWWTERDRTPRRAVAFHADVIGTRRNINYLREGKSTDYGTLQNLTDFALGLSPPPTPAPQVNTNYIWIQPPGVNTTPFYGPLLQLIQAGPGLNGVGQLGNVITLAHLQQITPQLLAVGQLFQQNPNLTFNQLLATTQGAVTVQAIQSILQPLGMWNYATLQAWLTYITPLQSQAQQTLTTLYNQLIQAQVLPPPVQQTVTTLTPITPTNPIEVVQQIQDIIRQGDAEEMAERLPSLIHSITAHEGFSVPQIYIHGSRSGRTNGLFPYKIGIRTERHIGEREVHILTEDGGYFVNDFASNTSRYWTGPDDASMVYIPIEIKSGKVKTLDVIASNSYAWHKRAAGGDTRLLSRASTHSTSLLSFDVAFLENKNLHLRLVGGSIPTASLGGVMGEFEIGEKEDIFDFRIGGGFTHKEYYFEDASDLVGYLDLEIRLRTPRIEFVNKDEGRGVRTWGSVVVASSGMAHLPTSRPYRKGERVKAKWGLQGDVRAVPEIHAQLVTPYALFEVSGGLTAGVVPGGDVNLEHAERTLSLHQIRSHAEVKIRIRLAKIINEWNVPNDITEKENLFLEFGFVTEFSEAVDKSRAGIRLEWSKVAFDFLLETERWHDTGFTDVRLGGGFSYKGIFVTGLHSIKEKDYRLEAGIDIASMIWDDDFKRKGLLESNW